MFINPYAIPPLIAGAINLFLAGLVYGRNPQKLINKTFAVGNLCLAIWNLGLGATYASPDKASALFWVKFYEAGMIFIPPTFFHIVLAVTENKDKNKQRLCAFAYGLSSLFLLTINTKLFNAAVLHHYWGYYPLPGIAAHTWNLLLVFFAIYGSYLLYQHYKTTKSALERNRLRYFLLAVLIAFAFGFTNFLPFWGISFYPIGNLMNALYGLIVAYAIVKYSLMDINIVVRKSIVYSLTTATITAFYILAVLASQALFQNLLGYKSLIPAALVALFLAFAFQPLKEKIQLLVDQMFYRKRVEYQQIIREFGELISSVIELPKLMDLFMDAVTQAIPVDKCSLFLLEEETGEYLPVASIGLSENARLTTKFREGEGIARALMLRGRALLRTEFKDNPLIAEICRKDKANLDKLGTALIVPLINKGKLIGMLHLAEKKSGEMLNHDDVEMLSILCSQTAVSIENANLYRDLQTHYLNTIYSLATALEAKDHYTRGHSERVTRYAITIAQQMRIPSDQIQILKDVTILHDIGKIGIKESILNKPGKLTKEEFAHVQQHPEIGELILKPIKSLEPGLALVRHHHERVDGEGYPDHLSETNLMMLARILTVADAYDAMTSERPYRRKYTPEEAINELKVNACSQFDPQVVRALIAILAREREISLTQLPI